MLRSIVNGDFRLFVLNKHANGNCIHNCKSENKKINYLIIRCDITFQYEVSLIDRKFDRKHIM